MDAADGFGVYDGGLCNQCELFLFKRGKHTRRVNEKLRFSSCL